MLQVPPNVDDANSAEVRPTGVRYLVLAILALAPASAYLTRIISAANTTIAAEFQATDKVMGDVMAGFALGYFVAQIPGGFLASSWGVRKTLPLISMAWSLCALLCTFAASPNELWMARVAIGVAQAGLVPCCAQALSQWFPISRRGIASSVMGGAMQLGGIAATELTARLLGPLGWRGALQAYSATGALWAIAFLFWFRNRPEEHDRVNLAECQLIACGREADSVAAEPATRLTIQNRLRLLLPFCASVSVWAFFIQAVFRAYAYEFFTTWCPAFLEKAYGLAKVDAASLTTWPLWTLAIGSLVSGYLVDAVMVRTGNRWLSRSGLAFCGLALCGACFAAATQIDNPRLVMGVIALGALLASVGGPATWAAAMDLGGRRAAVLAGAMNMMGNIGAYYCPKQVGQLFFSIENSTGNWTLVLWLFAGVNFVAALAWIFVNPSRGVSSREK
ncbi:MAG: MFS transporter [Planctomycetia bacterium]|nr:MFS transporter [Planctomycetia bacterium]